MLTLRTLGSLNLRDSAGNEIDTILSQPKRCALLVYLTVASPRGFHRRDTLLSLFWPERDDARGRNALSQSLSHLRRNLSGNIIVARGPEEIGLAPDSIRSDVAEFEAALKENRWADALEVYGGDFLRGFHVGDAWGFGEWLEKMRERLREAAAGAAWALARNQIEKGALVDAERTGQRALSLVWSDETPVRDFVRTLAEAGDRASALRFYEKFRSRLMDELELEPSQRTIEVVEAIRNGDSSPGLPRPDLLPSPEKPPGPVEPDHKAPDAPPDVPPDFPGPPANGPWKLWFWSLASAAIFCFAVVGVLRMRGILNASAPPPSDRPFTVLAEVGGGADAEERRTVAFLLRSNLDMAHVIQTVPLTEVERVLQLMEKEPDSPLDPGLAREVAVRLGVPTVVIPRLDHLGDEHILALRVEDVRDGVLRAEGRGISNAETGVVKMVDDVARDVRRTLGESRAALASTRPLPQVFTPSLEALEKYHLAVRLNRSGQSRSAKPLLWEAVALDSEFAMAWHLLSVVYGIHDAEPSDSAVVAAAKAQRFQNRLTKARRTDLELHRRMREDVALWDVALEDAERDARRDPDHLNNYAVYLAYEAGLPDSALNVRFRIETLEAEDARRFEPTTTHSTLCNITTHTWAAALHRMDEWLALLDSLQIDLPPDCRREAALFDALAGGEWDRAERMLGEAPADWRWPGSVETAAHQLVPLRGRIRSAHSSPSLENSVTQTLPQNHRGWSNRSHLILQLAYGLPLAEAPEETFGKGGVPKELRGPGRVEVTEYVLYGVREALLGDTVEARRVGHRLQTMRSESTSRTFEKAFEPWFLLLEMGPGIQRGDWRHTIDRLEPMAARIDNPGVGYLGGEAYLIRWILADAYVQVEQPDSAILHLESILARPKARIQDWMLQGYIHPPTLLKLGRLYAETGNVEKAREHYQAFLNTFTDPDPEFEWMVEEARAGLAGLGG